MAGIEVNIDERVDGDVNVGKVLAEFENEELNDFITENDIDVDVDVNVNVDVDTYVDIETGDLDDDDIIDAMESRGLNPRQDNEELTDIMWWMQKYYNEKNDTKYKEQFEKLRDLFEVVV